MQCELNIVAMAKAGQRWVFVFDDDSYEALMEVFDRFAADPDLSFTHGDAALLRSKVHELAARDGFHPFPQPTH